MKKLKKSKGNIKRSKNKKSFSKLRRLARKRKLVKGFNS